MIKVDTQYTISIYKEFCWFSLFRGKHYRFGMKILPIVTLLMIALTIYSILMLDSAFLSVMTFIVSVTCIALYLWAFLSPKKIVKNSPAIFQSVNSFEFTEDCFYGSQSGALASGNTQMSYSALQKAYETTNMFYLYISPQQAFLLSKDGFTSGNPDELRSLLQSKMPPKKYIICN